MNSSSLTRNVTEPSSDSGGATGSTRATGLPRFVTTSACPLSTPSGMMVGTYQMIRSDTGEEFEVAIPAFALDSPFETRRAS